MWILLTKTCKKSQIITVKYWNVLAVISGLAIEIIINSTWIFFTICMASFSANPKLFSLSSSAENVKQVFNCLITNHTYIPSIELSDPAKSSTKIAREKLTFILSFFSIFYGLFNRSQLLLFLFLLYFLLFFRIIFYICGRQCNLSPLLHAKRIVAHSHPITLGKEYHRQYKKATKHLCLALPIDKLLPPSQQLVLSKDSSMEFSI